MNWDQVEGSWKQLKGKAVEAWGEMTDDEWDKVKGKREQMVGLLQTKFGKAKADAEKAVDDWSKSL